MDPLGIRKSLRGGVLHNFVYRAPDNGKGNGCIKSIVNPRRVYKFTSPHFPMYLGPFYSIDEKGRKVDGWWDDLGKSEIIQINHYFTKSKEEWIKRRALGKADYKRKYKDMRTLKEFEEYDNNDVFDDEILRYIESKKKYNKGI